MIKKKWFILTVALLLLLGLFAGTAGANVSGGRIQPVEIIRSMVLSIVGDVSITNDLLDVEIKNEDPLPVSGNVTIENESLQVTGDVIITNTEPIPVSIDNDLVLSGTVDVDNFPIEIEGAKQGLSSHEAIGIVGSRMLTPMIIINDEFTPMNQYTLGPATGPLTPQPIAFYFDISGYSEVHVWMHSTRPVVITVSNTMIMNNDIMLKEEVAKSGSNHKIGTFEASGNLLELIVENWNMGNPTLVTPFVKGIN